MSKYKGKRDYEKEIEDAAERMKKYPEHLEHARENNIWIDFLTDNVGVNLSSVESDKGSAFWENVRSKILEKDTGFTARELIEANVELMTGIYRNAKGQFTKSPTSKPVYSYRSLETGKFVSPKKIRY